MNQICLDHHETTFHFFTCTNLDLNAQCKNVDNNLAFKTELLIAIILNWIHSYSEFKTTKLQIQYKYN